MSVETEIKEFQNEEEQWKKRLDEDSDYKRELGYFYASLKALFFARKIIEKRVSEDWGFDFFFRRGDLLKYATVVDANETRITNWIQIGLIEEIEDGLFKLTDQGYYWFWDYWLPKWTEEAEKKGLMDENGNWIERKESSIQPILTQQ